MHNDLSPLKVRGPPALAGISSLSTRTEMTVMQLNPLQVSCLSRPSSQQTRSLIARTKRTDTKQSSMCIPLETYDASAVLRVIVVWDFSCSQMRV